tara:strand:+ start:713 stop:1597 length:885 start_codon:yes stop_codon:yes gene_type:complete
MLRSTCFILATLLISGCSASYKELKALKTKNPNSFTDYLLEEYKEKAVFEAEQMHDWNSAGLYSKKALKAFEGEEIKPQKIEYWKLPKENISEISHSYQNLMNIYEQAKIVDPYNLAVAISSLDCWAEQQEEKWQTWDINKCKEDFLNAMHQTYENIVKNEKIKFEDNTEEITDSVSVITTNQNKELMQIIYFDFDEASLSKVSKDVIKKFILKNKKLISNFVIVGHADTRGSKQYNLKLSLKRAETVKNILIENGINEKNISILGKGEDYLAVETADNVAHPANRRAVISSSN